jgi:hypothetical protein
MWHDNQNFYQKIYSLKALFNVVSPGLVLFSEKYVDTNPIKKTKEKIKTALPYPPKKVTSAPIKKNHGCCKQPAYIKAKPCC